jgi:hypothetical protein
MDEKRSLIDEFWENAKLPISIEEVAEVFFDEFADFIDPKSYGGEGILRSIVKLFAEFLK